MTYEGNIHKMRTVYANPVNYFLPVGENEIEMNSLIGKPLRLQFTGQINCISCGKITKTSFNQGFCYNCLQTAPEASESVVRPELSKAQFGIARDMNWAIEHDLIDHVVYLAVTSGLKVGVTRYHQIPARWIDQGADRAIRLAQTPNRHIAGVVELFLKNHFSDRTNWQTMLKSSGDNQTNLLQEKHKAIQLLPGELQKYACNNNEIIEIQYPVSNPPQQVKSVSFDSSESIGGVLTGIKGQYLIFDNTNVLNIRKHNGYFLIINF